MMAARLQDIDPEALERQAPPGKVEIEHPGERRNVPIEHSDEIAEYRMPQGQVVERRMDVYPG